MRVRTIKVKAIRCWQWMWHGPRKVGVSRTPLTRAQWDWWLKRVDDREFDLLRRAATSPEQELARAAKLKSCDTKALGGQSDYLGVRVER